MTNLRFNRLKRSSQMQFKKFLKQTIPCLALVCLILGLSFTISFGRGKTDKLYVLNLYYNKGEFSLVDVFVKEGYAPAGKVQPEQNNYGCEVISSSRRTLLSFKFAIPRELSTEFGTILLEEVKFPLLVPYFKNAQTLNIYNPRGELKLKVDVSLISSAGEAKNGNFHFIFFLVLFIILAGAVIYYFFVKKTRGVKTASG